MTFYVKPIGEKMKKILSIILTLFSFAFVLTLCSCSSGVNLEGKDIFIVYNDESTDDMLSAVADVKEMVEETLDTTCKRITDTAVADGVKIVVGDTDYKESEEAKKNLLYDDYSITEKNCMIIIAGGSDDAVISAVDYFCKNYADVLKGGKFTSENSYTFKYDYNVSNAKISGVDISKYTIVYPDSMGTYSEKETLEKYVAQRLQKYFIDLCGVEIPAQSDACEKGDYEILIGKTSRDASENFYESNTPDKYGYILKVDKKSLNFGAGGLWGYTKAIESLENYVDGQNFTISSSLNTSDDSGICASDLDFVYITEDGVEKNPVSSFTIAGNDILKYKIVYDAHTSDYTGYEENEIHAAMVLQTYIEYATGIRLEAVDDSTEESEYEIVVGRTSRTTPNMDVIKTNEDVLIEVEGSKLYISGGEKRGTLYSAYTFLEDYLGVRFFASDCEIIYFADKLDIPDGTFVHEVSDLEYRENDAYDCLDEDTAVKLKINGAYQREMNYWNGGAFEFVGGSNGFVHTMGSILGLASQSSQPCFTDEETYQKCIKLVRGYLSRYGDTEIFSITQCDNNNYCTCANCQKINSEEGSNAGALIYFINRIADDIKDDYPNTKILTLAYMFSQDPPKTAPRDNVIIELCNFDVCVGHKIGSCDENKDFYNQLKGWSELTDNLYIWYYVANFVEKTEDTPIMNMDVLYDNFGILREYKITGFFAEAIIDKNSGDFAQLRTYLLSKLMWDPDMTKEQYNAYIDEFINAFYGQAGDVIHIYYDYLYSISGKNHYSLYTTPNSIFDEFEFKVNSEEISQWLDKAKELVKDDKTALRHIKQVITGFNFIKQELD